MSFLEYWRRIVTRTPQLDSHKKVTMETDEFRRHLQRAYNAGKTDSSTDKAAKDFGKVDRGNSNLADIFGSIFKNI